MSATTLDEDMVLASISTAKVIPSNENDNDQGSDNDEDLVDDLPSDLKEAKAKQTAALTKALGHLEQPQHDDDTGTDSETDEDEAGQMDDDGDTESPSREVRDKLTELGNVISDITSAANKKVDEASRYTEGIYTKSIKGTTPVRCPTTNILLKPLLESIEYPRMLHRGQVVSKDPVTVLLWLHRR